MIPPHFNVFRTHFPDESPIIPVVPSSAVDWDLIGSLDPDLISYEDKYFLKFLDAFPTYKLSSKDSKILSHPYAIRLFLIFQKALSAITQKIKYYVRLSKKQEREIAYLNQKLSDYEKINNNQSKEKCYACGKLFSTMKTLNAHMMKTHPHLKKSWKRIQNNDKVDYEDQMLIKLSNEINQLRDYIYQQDEWYKKKIERMKQKERIKQFNLENFSKKTSLSHISVQPRFHPPYTYKKSPTIKAEQIISNEEMDSEMLDDEMEYLGLKAQENVEAQARIVMNRKKKRFNAIREQLKITLEKQIPMPAKVEPKSSDESNNSSTKHSSHSQFNSPSHIDHYRSSSQNTKTNSTFQSTSTPNPVVNTTPISSNNISSTKANTINNIQPVSSQQLSNNTIIPDNAQDNDEFSYEYYYEEDENEEEGDHFIINESESTTLNKQPTLQKSLQKTDRRTNQLLYEVDESTY